MAGELSIVEVTVIDLGSDVLFVASLASLVTTLGVEAEVSSGVVADWVTEWIKKKMEWKV